MNCESYPLQDVDVTYLDGFSLIDIAVYIRQRLDCETSYDRDAAVKIKNAARHYEEAYTGFFGDLPPAKTEFMRVLAEIGLDNPND